MADEQENIKITFDTNADKAAKDVNKLGKEIDKTTNSTSKAKKSNKDLSAGLEGLGGGIGSTISSFKALLIQMWLLVANPVGLIIAAIALALVALVKAFTSTKAGGEKLEQMFAGIGAVMDVLRDRILNIGSALVKFFTGDFKGAMEEGKKAVNGFGDEVAEEFKKAADAKKSLQEVADAMRTLGVERAKLNRDLVEAKEIIMDENASYDDKKEAIERVQKAEGEQTKKELANAQKKLEAIRVQNALSDSSSEALKEEADAEAALYALQEQSASDRIKNLKLLDRTEKEEQTRIKEIQKARAEAAKERQAQIKVEQDALKALINERVTAEKTALQKIQNLNDKTDEEKLARQKERAEEEIEALRQKGIDVTNLLIYNEELYATLEQELLEKRAEEKAAKQKEIDDKELEEAKKKADEEIQIEKDKLAQKEAIENARVGLAEKALGFLSMFAGKNKALQKGIIIAESALGIGKSVIDTQRANAGALATPQAIATSGAAAAPVIAMNYASLALGTAANIAATSKALQSLGGGSAPSAGGAGGQRVAAPTPQVAFNNTAENQIGQSIGRAQTEQPPIKVVVAESDISDAQKNVKVLVDKNSF